MRYNLVLTAGVLLVTLSGCSSGSGAPAPSPADAPAPPRVVALTGAGTPTIILTAMDPNGDDITVTAIPPEGINTTNPVQTIPGGNGTAQFDFNSTNVLTAATGNVTFEISDGQLPAVDSPPAIEVVAPPIEFADDTLYAIPLQTAVRPGEPITVLVATGKLANPLFSMQSVRFIAPAGWSYVPDSFNVGSLGGERNAKDGVWSALPDDYDFLLMPDSFIESSTSNGGDDVGINFNVTPVQMIGGKPELSDFAFDDATGALFNFQITFDQPGTYDLGFEAESSSLQTFYTSSLQTNDDHDFKVWGDISNNYSGVAHTVVVDGPAVGSQPGDLTDLAFSIDATYPNEQFRYGGSVDHYQVDYVPFDVADADWLSEADRARLPSLYEAQIKAIGAQNLKTVFLDLIFEGDRLRPEYIRTGAATEDFFAAPLKFGLNNNFNCNVNVVACLIHPDDSAGFSGDGVIARVYFSPSKSWKGRDVNLTVPQGEDSRPLLSYDAAAGKLRIGHNLAGDFNQDSIVDRADILPICEYLGAPAGGIDEMPTIISGSSSTVTLAAVETVWSHFHQCVNSFNVYEGTPADYPDGGTLIGNLPFYGLGGPLVQAGSRRYYEFALPEPKAGMQYWVRPYDNWAPDGIASNAVSP